MTLIDLIGLGVWMLIPAFVFLMVAAVFGMSSKNDRD